MALHAAMIHRMDLEVGRVLEQLEAMGAAEDTLTLFLSDNGASAEIMVRTDGHDPKAPPGSAASYLCLGPGWSTASNTPFRRHKTWVHEGGCATPLIAHWPAGIRDAGAIRHDVGHVIDVVPTILELAGVSAADLNGPQMPGQSLVASFKTAAPVRRPSPLWWQHEGNRAIRDGDWKLVAAKGESWELFDLAEDRTEAHNLAESEPERVAEMTERWEAMWNEIQLTAAK